MRVEYREGTSAFTADTFVALARRVWPRDYDRDRTAMALDRTVNIGAWVGDQLVLRLAHPLSKSRIAELNEQFCDILRHGAIVQSEALIQEMNEPEIVALPRLVFTPHRRSFGRFRQLIDAINRPN